ncbi:replication factor C subunit 1 [Centruroides vittatus]|uniref:replication factor C subunit 1 n=1 Tax=Centruroides vittatus TaxID=120091 RepID=UPI00350EE50D
MDIRNFFIGGTNNASLKKTSSKAAKTHESVKENSKVKSKKRIIIDSDSDSEDPLPKSKEIRNKKRAVNDDSDSEDIFQTKPVKKSPKLSKQVPIDVDDFFKTETVKLKSETATKKNETAARKEKSPKKLSTKLAEAKAASKVSKTDRLNSRDVSEVEMAEKSKNISKKSPTKNSKVSKENISDKSFTNVKNKHDDSNVELKPSLTVKTESSKDVGDVEEKSFTNIKNMHDNSNVELKPGLIVKTESSKDMGDMEEMPKKHKTEDSNSSDKNQKRRSNYLQYRQYLDRTGPQALGTKQVPEGKPNCLAKLTFVITGVLESFERDDMKSIIEKYQGRVTTTVSKKTSYLIVGRDPGVSKIEKATKFNIKTLDEDGLLDLIRESGNNSSKENNLGEKSDIKPSNNTNDRENVKHKHSVNIDKDTKKNEKRKRSVESSDDENAVHKKSKDNQNNLSHDSVPVNECSSEKATNLVNKIASDTVNMWVDKYKPLTTKQIIGQQGDRSNVKKLSHWLLNWQKNLKSKPHHGSKDDGLQYKAALLSGPPGIGKTTSAHLVCKECGYDYIEMNASDTRSKKSLKAEVMEILGNKTLNNFVTGTVSDKKISSQHAIIMDEVDGMAGNEDRGGMQELIALIKSTKIPIICICNDRSSPKIRSLANYCFDLRFMRPRVEQIKSAMMSIAFKEKIQISASILQDMIVASNQDIRQVMHNLSLWCAKKHLTAEQAKGDIGKGTKNIKLGPFDVLRKIFTHSETKNMSIYEKSDLFFNDYSLIPLFVQENYINVQPAEAKGNVIKHLQLLSGTADSICDGDLVEKQIRNSNSWSLLPVEAIYSSVIPGDLMGGYLTRMINFPSWLGKNSTQNHIKRLTQELHGHMHLKISANKTDLNLDQLTLLKNSIVNPLIREELEGIPKSIEILKHYCLLRQDVDSIVEVTQWPGRNNPLNVISSKIKTAFTKAYNKEGITNPYSIGTLKKSKRKESRTDLLGEEEEVDFSESSENEDDGFDGMIKVKTKPDKKKEASVSKRKKKN